MKQKGFVAPLVILGIVVLMAIIIISMAFYLQKPSLFQDPRMVPIAPTISPTSSVGGANTPATVEPAQMLTAIPLATPHEAPLGLPITDEEYRNLKEQATLTPLPTNVNNVRDNP